jgi:hypothetical protein
LGLEPGRASLRMMGWRSFAPPELLAAEEAEDGAAAAPEPADAGVAAPAEEGGRDRRGATAAAVFAEEEGRDRGGAPPEEVADCC